MTSDPLAGSSKLDACAAVLDVVVKIGSGSRKAWRRTPLSTASLFFVPSLAYGRYPRSKCALPVRLDPHEIPDRPILKRVSLPTPFLTMSASGRRALSVGGRLRRKCASALRAFGGCISSNPSLGSPTEARHIYIYVVYISLFKLFVRLSLIHI